MNVNINIVTTQFNELGEENVIKSNVDGTLYQKKDHKYIIYKEIENGKYDVIIGTHALLNENLKFNNLGLVITDEQHRFGVNQRNTLQNKGMNKEADVLYLSATPIPRTYALTIYGDLDLSQIKTKPNIRKEIKTKVVYEQNIKNRIGELYKIKNVILQTVNQVESATLRRLLIKRYIQNLTWEKIAEQLNYSYKHVVHILHSKALSAIKRVLEKD